MKLKSLALRAAKATAYSLQRQPLPERHVLVGVPYFSQWESRELAGQILDERLSAADDPNWKASGAKTRQEYNAWSWSGCGMACTKMILAHRTGTIMPLVTLGKQCRAYGGYTMPLETSIGLRYKPYLQFVEQVLQWQAHIIVGAPRRQLLQELGQGNYVIASVSPLIRRPESSPQTRGGHLVLLLGYDLRLQEFYLHDPSGDTKETQEYATISFAAFKKFFSGRGIVVSGGAVRG